MHMIVMIDQTQRIVNRKRSFCALLLACLANTYHNRILFLECQEHIRSEFRLRTSQKMRDNAIKIRRTVNQWPLFTHLSQKHMPNLRQIAFFFFFFFFFDTASPGRTRILARTPLVSKVCTTRSRNSVSSSIEMFPSIMIMK